MADMRRTAGKPSEDEYLNCIRCGACLPVCPTYRELLCETASPRGRLALARKELEGDLPSSPHLRDQMASCFGCMACNEVCPVGLRPSELALDMRRWHVQLHPSRWGRFLFGSVVAKPARTELLTLPLRWVDRLGLRRGLSSPQLRRRLPVQARDWNAQLPPLPPHPLRRSLPVISEPMGESRFRVGFFLGCAQSLLFAAQSAATVRVLRRNDCTVITPRQAFCCGMPSLVYGHRDLAQRQARHNIALFEVEALDYVITDCATCGSMLKDYAVLLSPDPAWAERAARFAHKVRDVHEFLASIPLEKPKGRLDARVTYHDPCHLRRGQGIWRQPRELLRLIDGLDFVELPDADCCCGSAGSQLLTHYRTSVQVLDRKMLNVRSTGAGYVASGCPACRMQLNVGLQRSGLNMQVVHPVELLDKAYAQ